MRKGLDLVALATEIQRQANSKRDFLVDAPALKMDVPDDGGAVRLEFANEHFGITTTAHDQLAEKAGIPTAYYRKMQQAAPVLLANNVNHWFGVSQDRQMVRTLDGKARAVLSDRYRPLDNVDLAEAVLPVLQDLGCEVISADITDKRLYIKAVDQKVIRELPNNARMGEGHEFVKLRALSPSVTISNSEVGHGSLSVLGGTFDSFCTNLAYFPERSTKKYHIGSKYGEFAEDQVFAMLSDQSRALNDAALWSTIRDVVRGAFDAARFDALIGKLQAAQGMPITGDIPKAVEVTVARFGLSQTEGKSVLDHLIKSGDLTKFGLHNAVTRTAEDVTDYDRASEFEKLGGQIIELANDDWRRIAEAA